MAKAAARHRECPDEGRHHGLYSIRIIDYGSVSGDSQPKWAMPEPTMTGCGGTGQCRSMRSRCETPDRADRMDSTAKSTKKITIELIIRMFDQYDCRL